MIDNQDKSRIEGILQKIEEIIITNKQIIWKKFHPYDTSLTGSLYKEDDCKIDLISELDDLIENLEPSI